MIPVNFPIVGTILPRRDAMLRVFSLTGCNIILPPVIWVLNQDLQDFQDYGERLRFSSRGYS